MDTFYAVGGFNPAMLVAWAVVARRVGLEARRWVVKARGLEKDVLRVPGLYAQREEAGRDVPPAWIATGTVVVVLIPFRVALLGYAFLATRGFL